MRHAPATAMGVPSGPSTIMVPGCIPLLPSAPPAEEADTEDPASSMASCWCCCAASS